MPARDGVLSEVSTLAAQIKGLLAVNAQEDDEDVTKQTNFGNQFRDKWKLIDTALDLVFGDLKADGQDETVEYDHIDPLPGDNAQNDRLTAGQVEDMVEALDAIVMALSSEDGFLAAAAEDGVFEGSTAGGDKAATVAKNAAATFNAIKSAATVYMARSENTRFGVYSKESTEVADEELASDSMGAYAYSPMSPAKYVDLPQAGAAVYNGRTMAISMDGKTVYNGDISLQVRFRGKRVSGLVENLLDGDGDLFVYGFGKVAAIILAEADIDSDGSFTKIAERTGQIVFTAEPGSPQATPLNNRTEQDAGDQPVTVQGSSFAGRFVGNGAAAIGTWAIDASTNDAENLTAGFGADKGDDVPETAPTVSGGGIAMTALDGETEGISSVNAKTGVITLVPMVAAVDAVAAIPAVTVKGADLFDSGGTKISGDAFVASAIKAIEKQLSILNTFLALDELGDEERADTGRTAVWGDLALAINMVLGDRGTEIFNTEDYVTTDDDDSDADDDAKKIIADVLDALSNKTKFRAAVTEDGVLFGTDSAIVEGKNPKLDAIFARVAHETTVEYASTSYTRLGAWNRVISNNGDDLPVPPEADANGVFAYSPLAATAYSVGDPNFPFSGEASYEGTTIARSTTAEGDRLNTYFEGDILVTVNWGVSLGVAGQAAEVGTVNAAISNLRDSKGVLYVSGRDDDDLTEDNNVETILFTAADIDVMRAAAGNTLSFSKTGSDVRVRHADIRQADLDVGVTGNFAGQFVGKVIDGPLGVIGTWSVDGVTGGDALEGVYGADLAP